MASDKKSSSDNQAKLLAIASAFAKFVDEADKASLSKGNSLCLSESPIKKEKSMS